MRTLPLFYFPTTILLVDDDELLLQHLKSSLGNIYNVLTFTNPEQAEPLVNNQKLTYKRFFSESLTASSLVNHQTQNNTYVAVEWDLKQIIDLPNSINKIEEISVMVVDYNMPNTTGLDLCRKINNHFIKKILLTGEADEKKAVEAFNSSLINIYIKKGEANTIDDLQSYIDILSYRYFIELTEPLRQSLEASGTKIFSDPKFIELFTNLLKEKSIKEYYFVNKNGTFLLIDNYNNKYTFVIYDEEKLVSDFIEPYQLIPELDNYIKQIQEKKLIPCFEPNLEPAFVEPQKWKNYLCQPQELKGEKDYYWGILPLI